MKIKKVLCTEVLTGFYMDDKEAIKRGAQEDGLVYKGEPVTPGFKHIRQPGVAVSVMFVLENGDIAYGDSPQPGGPIKPGDSLLFVIDLLDAA